MNVSTISITIIYYGNYKDLCLIPLCILNCISGIGLDLTQSASITSTIDSNTDEWMIVVASYLKTILPPKANDEYYTPFLIGSVLARHKIIVIDDVKITRLKVMKVLIDNEFVPVSITSLYKLAKNSIGKLIRKEDTWTSLRFSRRRAFLLPLEFAVLVNKVKDLTIDGAAMSVSELRHLIQDHIRDCALARNKFHLLPPYIPLNTLNSYVNRIKCQSVFNILAQQFPEFKGNFRKT